MSMKSVRLDEEEHADWTEAKKEIENSSLLMSLLLHFLLFFVFFAL